MRSRTWTASRVSRRHQQSLSAPIGITRSRARTCSQRPGRTESSSRRTDGSEFRVPGSELATHELGTRNSERRMDALETLLRGLPQAIASGLVYGSIYALIAQGYYVTFSTTQTLNFAQGDFLMIGGLLAFTVFGGLMMTGASLVVALLEALAVIPLLLALMGTLVERVAVRPLRGAFSLGWILSTVGVAVILRNASEVIWG